MATTNFGGGFNNYKTKYGAENITKKIVAVMEDAIKVGEEAMVERINTSGTDNDWGGPWPLNPNRFKPGWREGSITTGSGGGRVQSGDMRDSVGSKLVSANQHKVHGSVGWLEGSPEYAQWQEHGFRHAISGQQIEGMQSLAVAREAGELAIERGLIRLIKEL